MTKEELTGHLRSSELGIFTALSAIERVTEEAVEDAGSEMFIRVPGGVVLVAERGEVTFIPSSNIKL